MASVPKGLILGLCVFAGLVVHGFLTKPPAYEKAGDDFSSSYRFNRYTGEFEEKHHNSGKNIRWVVYPGWDQDRIKPSTPREPLPEPIIIKPTTSQEQ